MWLSFSKSLSVHPHKIEENHYLRKSEYKGKSIEDILSMNIQKEDKRASATLNKHIMRVKQFLRWAAREDYIDAGLDGYLESVSDKVRDNEKRDAFTDNELTLLFHNEVYERGQFKDPSRYWLPLLALFTGARGEELAQLFSDDIVCDDVEKIYYIHIRENESRNQKLKNISAIRIVPIHDRLIALGFLDFVQLSKDNSMLFPELDKSDGKRFKKFGNNFNRKSSSGWKGKCGVTRDRTSFHSFRHNVVDFFAKSNIDQHLACSLVGHSFKSSGLVNNYIKPAHLKDLHRAINVLKFPAIDWRKIKKLDWGRFVS